MSDDRTLILNELYQFAEHFDAGRFKEALGQFRHGKFLLGQGRLVGPSEMAQIWQQSLILQGGVPCTRHVITNPILTIDKIAGRATCRSVYTVYQQTDAFPLQVVLCGRYDDVFRKIDDAWRFVQRDYRLVDLVGDVSQHLQPSMAEYLNKRDRSLAIVK